MARRYDVQSDSILFANNQPYTRDSYSIAGMGETIEDMLRFCRQMYAMKVDNAEYALLTAIVIFSGNAIITVSALYCLQFENCICETVSV
jgi:ecdysone receptor